MRVLLIQSWLKVGGAELLTVELARALVRKGHRVAIACAFVEQAYLPHDLEGIEVIQPWPWVAALCRRSRFLFGLLGCPALVVLVLRRASRFDLLNPHNFPAFWIACGGAALYGKPLVWHFNEPAPGPKWLLRIDRRLVPKARAITVLDERTRAKVQALFRRDATVVRAGVDFAFWSRAETGQRAQQRYGLAGRLVLLSVGKLHAQKNQIMLVEALGLLKEEIPGLTLVLVGDGPDRGRVVGRARELGVIDHLILTGKVDADLLRSLYRSAFLVCFPALDQTWGLTPFEALCQKTVSLVSSQSGVAEVLGPNGIGLVADCEPAAFAEGIRRAHRQREQVQQMAEKGFAFTQGNITWDQFGEAMLRVFHSGSGADSFGADMAASSSDGAR